ncbi:MAG: imidazolonepropionase [Gammaproteobacteria bacterium]|jgi:imidazolonepropionase|nr:imidazolonepropionase [Gammaproteobacteria bacterium]MDH3846287.1 imidazolonepropionase [Gammaproteobacteria bacterium]MDH3865361.1 imidazolonepropionase [Gammaproteobacteria bacterium]MDH3904880.1 imidazolonepropionase [Gammaproteobacteria bacterium]MDH3954524.1 imidazolonepropionase [Gammaproteobacteria bacterium]
MADWDLLLTDARIATMRQGAPDYGTVDAGAIGIAGGIIDWIGPATDLPDRAAAETCSLAGRWLTPALIDCHTHLVFGGTRAAEYERRLQGVSYEEIAAEGGGILSTVKATRAASDGQLHADALARLQALAREGVATVEIKSGYGLDLDNELKMLRVARRLGEDSGLTVRTTLLAAHTVAPEFAGDADAYMDHIVNEILPAVAGEGLADAVDAYCESIAFDASQVERLFARAQQLELRVKLHADQLSDGGGAELAARFGALSADHLEYTSPEGVSALAESGTAAVLLPGAYLTLNEKQRPPVEALRDSGVPVALATDCNPGTSPLCSIHFAMGLGSRLFGLTPEECLAGVTREAARALGLGHDRGTLEIGKRADIAAWDFDHPRQLAYWLGTHPLSDLLIAGRSFSPNP